jgi:hypothetical protein
MDGPAAGPPRKKKEKDGTCNREVCDKPKTAEGNWTYCSAECRRISNEAHGAPLPRKGLFSWLG